MTAAIPIDMNEYRVVLVDPESRSVCALMKRDEYRLLRIDIPQRTRPARQLQKALRDVWGLTVLILDCVTETSIASACAFAHLLQGELPAEFRTVQPDQIPSYELSDLERILLQEMLDGKAKNPLVHIGWIDEAIAWLEASTGRRVLSKANVVQYNASGDFALVRFPTDNGCDYWLKTTGSPNTHERPVTSLLSKLCGDYVPEVVAERPAWNAWLMRGDGDSIVALPTEVSAAVRLLEVAVRSLARMQVRTAGSELDLLTAGTFDHRTQVLQNEAEALFADMDEAMGLQTSTKVPRVETKRLHELRSMFEDACSRMEDLQLPDTVLHGDLNLGNILLANDRCVFIDWCEARVGNPLVTLEHLLLLTQIGDPALNASCEQRLRELYRNAMSTTCDPRSIGEGFAYAQLIATVSALFGRGDWLRTPWRADPRRQAYVRGVARHMDRVAREPTLLEALSA